MCKLCLSFKPLHRQWLPDIGNSALQEDAVTFCGILLTIVAL